MSISIGLFIVVFLGSDLVRHKYRLSLQTIAVWCKTESAMNIGVVVCFFSQNVLASYCESKKWGVMKEVFYKKRESKYGYVNISKTTLFLDVLKN